jgi:hypothetical protein
MAADTVNRPASYSELLFAPSLATAQALHDGTRTSVGEAVRINLDAVGARPSYVFTAAQNCAALGVAGSALDLLLGYYLGRGPWARSQPVELGRIGQRYTGFLFNPLMADLHNQPRFAALLEEIGLEDYWRSLRTAPDFRRFERGG